MTGYTRLLKSSYRAIKAKDRRATVVLAGMTNRAWNRLAWLYRSGARRYFDVAAIHPFTRRPDDVLEAVRRFRAVMRRHGRRERRKPVWVTEMGWSGAKGRMARIPPFQTWATSDRNVARNLTRAYSLLARNRRRLGLRRVYWYTWASDYRGDGFVSIFEYSGLLRYRGGRTRRMPAWRAYLRSARRYEGCAKTSVGACAR